MMEHWPSLDADGIAASLAKVDEAEIYIGIIAHRYGFIPKGQDKSITEMEYERAVARGIPRLIFLMDETHPLLISQIEIEAAEKLRSFKERLKSERVVSFFKSADDLSAKAIQSLSNLGPTSSSTHKDSKDTSAVCAPVFDPRNYVFYVPYRPKGDQVVGRDVSLKAVRNQLVSGHKTAIGQTASFQGLGGLGKTQLAVEYAQLFRDQYPNGVIWLNADQDIDGQLIKIAEKAYWVAAESEHKDKLAIAKQRIKTHSHCLIIFDNLEKPEAIKEYLPEPEAEPHILVTSRFDQPNFVPVPLDILDSESSIKLLTQEAGQSPTTENELIATKDIAEQLGGLPLALELAGAYLRHRPIGWISYRDLLNDNLKAAMPGKFLSGSFTRHESDIYSTLRINEGILSEEPLLREILNILTWSGSGAMGYSLLNALLETSNQPHFQAALSLGVSLRLLQKTPGTESYALHRLVREVRREEVPLAERQDWSVKLSKRLADWFQPLKRDFAKLPAFEAEIGHLRAWQTNIERIAPKLASRLVWLQAYPPFHRGRPKEAHDWLQNAGRLLGTVQEEDGAFLN